MMFPLYIPTNLLVSTIVSKWCRVSTIHSIPDFCTACKNIPKVDTLFPLHSLWDTSPQVVHSDFPVTCPIALLISGIPACPLGSQVEPLKSGPKPLGELLFLVRGPTQALKPPQTRVRRRSGPKAQSTPRHASIQVGTLGHPDLPKALVWISSARVCGFFEKPVPGPLGPEPKTSR